MALIFATSASGRDAPVIGDTCSEIRRIDGELVDEAAAPAEANRTDLAVRGGMLPQIIDGADGIGDSLRLIELADHVAGLILVGGRATRRRQEIGAERQESFEGEAARRHP